MTLHVDLLYYWILGLMVVVFGGALLAWSYYKIEAIVKARVKT